MVSIALSVNDRISDPIVYCIKLCMKNISCTVSNVNITKVPLGVRNFLSFLLITSVGIPNKVTQLRHGDDGAPPLTPSTTEKPAVSFFLVDLF